MLGFPLPEGHEDNDVPTFWDSTVYPCVHQQTVAVTVAALRAKPRASSFLGSPSIAYRMCP